MTYQFGHRSIRWYLWRRLRQTPYLPIRWWRELRWFIQRGRRGWADCDYWGLRDYLAVVLVGLLTDLRKKGIGYPGCPGAETPEEWDAILRDMITGFRLAAEDELWDWSDHPEYKRAMELFAEWFPALWD